MLEPDVLPSLLLMHADCCVRLQGWHLNILSLMLVHLQLLLGLNVAGNLNIDLMLVLLSLSAIVRRIVLLFFRNDRLCIHRFI